jgi:hypothetical protein
LAAFACARSTNWVHNQNLDALKLRQTIRRRHGQARESGIRSASLVRNQAMAGADNGEIVSGCFNLDVAELGQHSQRKNDTLGPQEMGAGT